MCVFLYSSKYGDQGFDQEPGDDGQEEDSQDDDEDIADDFCEDHCVPPPYTHYIYYSILF